MDIKDSYLHGTVGVVKSINVNADELTYTLADKQGTQVKVTLPQATVTTNGVMSNSDKAKLDNLNVDYFSNIVNYKISLPDNSGRNSYILIAKLTNWINGKSSDYGFVGRIVGYSGGNQLNTSCYNLVAMLSSYVYNNATTYVKQLYVDKHVEYLEALPYVVTYNGENYLALRKLGSGTEIYFEGAVKNVLPQSQWIVLNTPSGKDLPDNMTVLHSPNFTDAHSITTSKYFDGSHTRTLLHSGNHDGYTNKVKQNVTTSNASYPLLLAPSGQTATTTEQSYFDSGVALNPSTNTITANISGNADTATKLATTRKLWGLDFDGSADVSGSLSDVTSVTSKTSEHLVLRTPSGSNKYIYLRYNNDVNTSVLLTGSYFAPSSDSSEKLNLGASGAKWNTVYANTLTGNLNGQYVDKLTGYTKATAAANIAATDTLNTALGKLEYKAHYAYDWVIGVTATDTDEYINKWDEIVGFLDSVKEGTDILDEFVTRKTDQSITGVKTFDKDVWFAAGNYDKYITFSSSTSPATAGTNSWRIGYIGSGSGDANNLVLQSNKGTTDTWDSALSISNVYHVATFAGNVVSPKFVTTNGTSSQFVKGDGSLDSNSYVKPSDLPSLDQSGFNRILFERFNRGTITGINPITEQDLVGKTLTAATLVDNFKSFNVGDEYLGRLTTYLYFSLATEFSTSAYSDDGSTLYLNDAVVVSLQSCVATEVTLNFVKGWNKIVWVFNENIGGDNAYFTPSIKTARNLLYMNAFPVTTPEKVHQSYVSDESRRLESTTIISSKSYTLNNTAWTDTTFSFTSLATGTYAIQVTSETNLVASGIMSVYTNLSDTVGDEIPLHVYGTAGWRPYLRTYANKLLISSNDASETSRTVTIKIAQIL